MSIQYICQNCQGHYNPPRRKDGICKACSNAVLAGAAKEEDAIRQQLAADIEAAKERAELRRQNAKAAALRVRYQPPSINDHLRI
jgi:hypothetical protein